MKFDMKFDVIRKAIIIMITDPEFDHNLLVKNKLLQEIIIDYALHFEKMFYKHEVGNMVEFFQKMHNKEIHRKYYSLSLDTDIKNIYFNFIDTFLEIYNKKATSDEFKFPKRKTILQSTLNEIKNQLESLKQGMAENINYNESILNKIYNDYLKIISNIEDKLEKSEQPLPVGFRKDSNSVSTFLSYIKKAKMSYIINISDQKTIYPFIYDFLLHLFLIDTRLAINSSSYVERKDIFNQLKKVRENLSHPSEDSRYMNIEYLKIAELLTYIEPEELEQYLLYHYSNVLKCEYTHILSIFKQFKYEVTDHHKHKYVYKDFSFVSVVSAQDFRHLSLYVQLD